MTKDPENFDTLGDEEGGTDILGQEEADTDILGDRKSVL